MGLERAGLECVAAIDSDFHAVETFKRNFPNTPHVLQRDLTKFTAEHLRALIGDVSVDVIVGGPPCQGFSTVRMVDGANHGDRLVSDPRRKLYRNYLHYVEFFRPSMFIMENVPGIRSAAGGAFFASIQQEARALGYRVHATPIHAWKYGVPQKRERQLIIGTKCSLPLFALDMHVPWTHEDPSVGVGGRRSVELVKKLGRPRKLQPPVTLWEAIGDLPPLAAGKGEQVVPRDTPKLQAQIDRYGTRYLKSVLGAHKSKVIRNHVARHHSERDLRDFSRLREGETCRDALLRGEAMEFPYDRDTFKDRYTRQHRNRLCSTIVAHLSKDGLMFIHPTQRRSLTVREAARVQSFPDAFWLPNSRTVAYRLVGNAVPPLLGYAIGSGIKRYLEPLETSPQVDGIPESPREAVDWLLHILDGPVTAKTLQALSVEEFRRAWFSASYLHTWLHPDQVENGHAKTVGRASVPILLAELAPEIAFPAYACSGWPTRLVPLAREAGRRLKAGKMKPHEYYFSAALLAGWKYSNKKEKARGKKRPA